MYFLMNIHITPRAIYLTRVGHKYYRLFFVSVQLIENLFTLFHDVEGFVQPNDEESLVSLL